jgi:hypothetical protein
MSRTSANGSISPSTRRDGALQRDRADPQRIRAVLGGVDRGAHFIERRTGASGGERHQVDPRKALRRIAFVAIEMTLLLDQRAPMLAAQHPHRHVVGQRAGGEERAVLLAQ